MSVSGNDQSEGQDGAADSAKRLRNLQKKLRQVQQLKEKQTKGEPLDPEQLAKIRGEAGPMRTLLQLLPVPSLAEDAETQWSGRSIALEISGRMRLCARGKQDVHYLVIYSAEDHYRSWLSWPGPCIQENHSP